MSLLFSARGSSTISGPRIVMLAAIMLTTGYQSAAWATDLNTLPAEGGPVITPCKTISHHSLDKDLLHRIFRRMTASRHLRFTSSLDLNPATLSRVATEYIDTYPQGISVSPDGRYVLTRVLDKHLHYGLAVVSLPSLGVLASYASDGDMLRSKWSPDGTQIAFFMLKNGESKRDLHVWNFRDGRDRVVLGVHSYAESQVTWSPDSRMIGYSDPEQGMVVVNVTTSERTILTAEQPVSAFVWAPDSQSIMAFAPNDSGHAVRMNLRGEIIRDFTLRDNENGRELAWSDTASEVLLKTKVTTGKGHMSRISTLNMTNGIEVTLYESKRDLYSPQFVPAGDGITFLEHSACCRDLFYLKNGTDEPVQLTTLQGWSDFGSNSPYEDMVPYEHFSGDQPHELRGASLNTMKDGVLYKDPDGNPGSSLAIPVSTSVNLGQQLKGVLWKPAGRPLGLIVELHNVSGVETPTLYTYDAEYRNKALIVNRSGYAYLYVNCYLHGIQDDNEELTTQTIFGSRLSALVESVQSSLHISAVATALVGYSVGTAVVLSSAVDAPERFGTVVLVGLSERRPREVDRILPENNAIHVLLVEATLDKEGTPSGIASTKLGLVRLGYHANVIETLVVDDVHLLMHPASWIIIQAAVLDVLQSGCKL